jgi:hypothetical protein
LHSFVGSLLEAEEITIPLKILFNELLEHIVKMYRVVSLENGHLMIMSLNQKASEYLIDLVCQISQN